MKKKILFIFCLSLIAQLTFMYFVNITLEQDAYVYYDLGKTIAQGGGFTENGKPCPNFSIKPLYCIFLAGSFKIFGTGIFMIKIIQAILIALSCVLVFRTVNIVFDSKIAYWSGLITAIYPPFWVISSHLIPESLFILLLILSIYILVRAEKEDKTKLFIYSAIFMGLSTQVRPTSTFLPLFIFFFVLLKTNLRVKLFKRFILFFLIVIACMAPWTIRNYIVFKIFSPVSSFEVIWQGTYVEGSANPDNLRLKQKQQELLSGVKDYTEYNKVALEAAKQNLKKNFLGYLALSPIKFVRLWVGSYSNLFNIKIFYSALLKSPSLMMQHWRIFLFKSFNLCLSIVLLFLGLSGIYLVYRSTKWKQAYILFLVFAYFSLLHMVLFAEPRYGIPALPYLITFAIFAVDHFLVLRRKYVPKE